MLQRTREWASCMVCKANWEISLATPFQKTWRKGKHHAQTNTTSPQNVGRLIIEPFRHHYIGMVDILKGKRFPSKPGTGPKWIWHPFLPENLADGMVLVVDYWQSQNLNWLDGVGCGYGAEYCYSLKKERQVMVIVVKSWGWRGRQGGSTAWACAIAAVGSGHRADLSKMQIISNVPRLVVCVCWPLIWRCHFMPCICLWQIMAIRFFFKSELAWSCIELKVSSKFCWMVQFMQTSPDGLPVVIFRENKSLRWLQTDWCCIIHFLKPSRCWLEVVISCHHNRERWMDVKGQGIMVCGLRTWRRLRVVRMWVPANAKLGLQVERQRTTVKTQFGTWTWFQIRWDVHRDWMRLMNHRCTSTVVSESWNTDHGACFTIHQENGLEALKELFGKSEDEMTTVPKKRTPNQTTKQRWCPVDNSLDHLQSYEMKFWLLRDGSMLRQWSSTMIVRPAGCFRWFWIDMNLCSRRQ